MYHGLRRERARYLVEGVFRQKTAEFTRRETDPAAKNMSLWIDARAVSMKVSPTHPSADPRPQPISGPRSLQSVPGNGRSRIYLIRKLFFILVIGGHRRPDPATFLKLFRQSSIAPSLCD